jgi:hypothetical protein
MAVSAKVFQVSFRMEKREPIVDYRQLAEGLGMRPRGRSRMSLYCVVKGSSRRNTRVRVENLYLASNP